MNDVETWLRTAIDLNDLLRRMEENHTVVIRLRTTAIQATKRGGQHTWASIGAALGVSAQRAEQMSRQVS